MKTKVNELENHLRRRLHWTRTTDPTFPWQAILKTVKFRLRINDFPQEPLYTLLVDGKEVGQFDDWPECWKKHERAVSTGRLGKSNAAAGE